MELRAKVWASHTPIPYVRLRVDPIPREGVKAEAKGLGRG